MAAEICDIKPGHGGRLGRGPVGQFAIAARCLLGAERVIAIDRLPERLEMALRGPAPRRINYEQVDVAEALLLDDRRRGPDACIDAVGLEAHGHGRSSPGRSREEVLRGSPIAPSRCDKRFALAATAAWSRSPASMAASSTNSRWARVNRGLTLKRANARAPLPAPLLEHIERGEHRPSLRHHPPRQPGRGARDVSPFRDKQDDCIKVVMKPH